MRTKKIDDFMGVNPIYNDFSKNNYLKYYKRNLVNTGNVDHIIPFKHSQK